MQEAPKPIAKPPVGVIYDSDFGNRIDDALALALLYGFDGKNECRVVSVSTTKSNVASAAFCEIVGRFYAGDVSGSFFSFRRTLPVGMSEAGVTPDETPMLKGVLGKRNAEGAPVYAHGIHKANDTAEPHALIRNALTAQHDGNAMVILAGPATNLVQAVQLPGMKDLITRKVRYLVISAGSFEKADVPSAKKLLSEWPGSIVSCGLEIGQELTYPGASIEKDFAWSPNHPIADAYRAYKPMPYDAPATAMAAVLYAIRPQETYFQLSEPGVLNVLENVGLTFSPNPSGKHRHLMFDPAQKERISKVFVEVASAKPVPRMPRFRQQQQQQQQNAQPPKPATDAAKPPVN